MDLDELVYEEKAAEAAAINNEGEAAQLAYLLRECGREDVLCSPCAAAASDDLGSVDHLDDPHTCGRG